MSTVSPKGWTLDGLLGQSPRFKAVPRCKANDPNLLERIELFERDGVPLIIEGWHLLHNWPKTMFTVDWLLENTGREEIQVRNVVDRTDSQISFSDFVVHSRRVAAQWMSDGSQQGRLYNKDAHCPLPWAQWVQSAGILPEQEKVESLMCYLGVGGTFTPCHKDLCASSGQNLMCHTEDSGSSFWFMTESQAAPEVAKYFQTVIGKELDWEDHTASVEDFAKAPFTVFIAEQSLGDLVLVPPRSSHQVVNYGGLTVKTSWSRMTVAGLTTALYHELPLYRRVCRAEQYRVKYILYRALTTMTNEIQQLTQAADENNAGPYANQLRDVIGLFDFVLQEEYVRRHGSIGSLSELPSGSAPFTLSNLACDFCTADIFQTFFECARCGDNCQDSQDVGNGLIICSSCYVEGRTCTCGRMHLRQCRVFSSLLADRNTAAEACNAASASTKKLPVLDESALQGSGKVMMSEAADVLRERRIKLGSETARESACRPADRTASHRSLPEEVMRCKLCHSGKCFRHLLSWGVHSAEAILLWGSDQDRWHSIHQEAKGLFVTEQEALQVADRRGYAVPFFNHKLISLARDHSFCRPANALWTRPGWYDEGDDSHTSTSTTVSENESCTDSYAPAGQSRSLMRRRSAPVIPTMKLRNHRSLSRGPALSSPLSIGPDFLRVNGQDISLWSTASASETSPTLFVDRPLVTAKSLSAKRRSPSPTGNSKGVDGVSRDVPPTKRQRREMEPVTSRPAISYSNSSILPKALDVLSENEALAIFAEAFLDLRSCFENQRSHTQALRLNVQSLTLELERSRNGQRTRDQDIHRREQQLRAAEGPLKNVEGRLESIRAEVDRGELKRVRRWMDDAVNNFKAELVEKVKEDISEYLFPLVRLMVKGLVQDHLRSMELDARSSSEHARMPEPGPSSQIGHHPRRQDPGMNNFNNGGPSHHHSRLPPNPSKQFFNQPPSYPQNAFRMNGPPGNIQRNGPPPHFNGHGSMAGPPRGFQGNSRGGGHPPQQYGHHSRANGPSSAANRMGNLGVNNWVSRS